jgi:hypothetical protein
MSLNNVTAQRFVSADWRFVRSAPSRTRVEVDHGTHQLQLELR